MRLVHYFDCLAVNVASKQQPTNCEQPRGRLHKMHQYRALNLQNFNGTMQKGCYRHWKI